MLSRRAMLQIAGAAAFPRPARPGDRRPNLLFIIADDHAGYVLGAQGNPQARTPNLDRLAAEGTHFARHYCNSPVCTPSRRKPG
jgi:arylsulfatase A-like enzyme